MIDAALAVLVGIAAWAICGVAFLIKHELEEVG